MKLFASNVTENSDKIIELIECGERLLLIKPNGEHVVVDREKLNNKCATALNCSDGEVLSFHIVSEFLELFGEASCYTDFVIDFQID